MSNHLDNYNILQLVLILVQSVGQCVVHQFAPMMKLYIYVVGGGF